MINSTYANKTGSEAMPGTDTTPKVAETASNKVWSQEAFEAAGYTEILPRTDYSIHDAAAVELIAEASAGGTAAAEVVGHAD